MKINYNRPVIKQYSDLKRFYIYSFISHKNETFLEGFDAVIEANTEEEAKIKFQELLDKPVMPHIFETIHTIEDTVI